MSLKVAFMILLLSLAGGIISAPTSNRGVADTNSCNSPEVIRQAILQEEGGFLCTDQGDIFKNSGENETCVEELFVNNTTPSIIVTDIYVKTLPSGECADILIEYYQTNTNNTAKIHYGNYDNYTSDQDKGHEEVLERLKNSKFIPTPWIEYADQMESIIAGPLSQSKNDKHLLCHPLYKCC